MATVISGTIGSNINYTITRQPEPTKECCGPQNVGIIAHATYIHDQITPATLWEINHNLGRMPAVTVVDSAGNVVFTDIVYVDENNIQIVITSAFGGKAYLI